MTETEQTIINTSPSIYGNESTLYLFIYSECFIKEQK